MYFIFPPFHPTWIGEGIAGALDWRELMQLATEVGFAPPVLVKSTIYASEDPVIKNLRGIYISLAI